jgi:hypothetical protein
MTQYAVVGLIEVSIASIGGQGSGMTPAPSKMDSKESVLYSLQLHLHFQVLSSSVWPPQRQRTPPKLFQVPSSKSFGELHCQ